MTIVPHAGGFSFEGGPTGVLLIHGFAGAPQNLWPVAEVLWRRGYTVEAPRLPGHGTVVSDLAATTPEMLADAADAAYTKLKERCDEVFVVGISFGGSLASHVASQHPDVAGLVAMAAPLFAIPALEAMTSGPDAPAGIPVSARDAVLDRSMGLIAYDEFPTQSLAAVLRFGVGVGERLGSITAPALFIYGDHDGLVEPAQGERAAALVKGSSLLALHASGHEVTLDNERELVVGTTVKFIDDNSKQAR